MAGARSSKIEAAGLAQRLAGWRDEDVPLPLPRQLAKALQDARLPAGTVLPSSRALAQVLGVARSTVTEAYSQLSLSGWVEAHQGSGTRVRGRGGHELDAAWRLMSIAGQDSDLVDLSSGALSGLPDVTTAVEELRGEDIKPYLAHDGYWPHGIPALRQAVANHYTRHGLSTSPDEVVITGGSQQAIALLAKALLADGDRVVVEDPTYRGALAVFAQYRCLPVPMMPDGMAVEVLQAVTRQSPARVVYSLPTAHNPTGCTMPTAVRQRLATLCRQRGMVCVEDASTAETFLEDRQPPPMLAQLLPSELSVTIGTMSKIWWGGLRIGWVRARPDLVDRLAELRRSIDLAGPVLDQLVAVKLLDTHLETHRAQRRRWLRSRLETTEAALNELAPEWRYRRPSGGTTMWVRVPGVNCVTLCSLARHELGIKATPGSSNSATEAHSDVLRIPFAADPGQLRLGLVRLVELARDPRVHQG